MMRAILRHKPHIITYYACLSLSTRPLGFSFFFLFLYVKIGSASVVVARPMIEQNAVGKCQGVKVSRLGKSQPDSHLAGNCTARTPPFTIQHLFYFETYF
ncbi:hypothetical protein F4823DRAFT_587911, partial [Ustulina deusta]